MLDTYRAHVTDFGQANRGETDVIMTKVRDKSTDHAWRGLPVAGWLSLVGRLGDVGGRAGGG